MVAFRRRGHLSNRRAGGPTVVPATGQPRSHAVQRTAAASRITIGWRESAEDHWMHRRDFIAAIAAAAADLLATRGQPAERVRLVGVLFAGQSGSVPDGFREELAK